MNVAFVTGHKLWGGVKIWMLEFAPALKGLGCNVAVFANDERLIEAATQLGLPSERLRFGFDGNPIAIALFVGYFIAHKIDVVVLNVQKDLRTAGIAARLLGLPVVQHIGGRGDVSAKWNQRLGHRLIVDRVVTTSQAVIREITDDHSYLNRAKMTCIYNGRYSRDIAPGVLDRPIRLVITARLSADKGHLMLLNALARLKGEGLPQFHLDVFGEGPMRPALESRIAALGLGQEVSLRGFVTRVDEHLTGYHFGVLTSGYESLPNTILEYMAAGLPSIAPRVGGIPEGVIPHVNGFLFEPESEAGLTDCLRSALTLQDDAYTRLSANALHSSHTTFNLVDKAKELLALLHLEVAQKRTRRSFFRAGSLRGV
jgi:glycosyltransferase involved in cell wall biosynthesis